MQLIQEAQQFKPDIKAAFVINRRITGTAIGKEIEGALVEMPFPILKTVIAQRVAFAESSAGYTVIESSVNSVAANEIKALSKEILKVMGEKSW